MSVNIFQSVRGSGTDKEQMAVYGNGQTKDDLQESGEWIAMEPDSLVELEP